jgi:predicted small metal-binding protein
MKEFRCGEIVPGCAARFEGDSEDEILRQVAAHARDEHALDSVPPEVVDDIRSRIADRAAGSDARQP